MIYLDINDRCRECIYLSVEVEAMNISTFDEQCYMLEPKAYCNNTNPCDNIYGVPKRYRASSIEDK